MQLEWLPIEVGLTVKGEEPHGRGYERQPYAERVVFGPATYPWGHVDGYFVIDAKQRRDFEMAPEPVYRGTTLGLILNPEVL